MKKYNKEYRNNLQRLKKIFKINIRRKQKKEKLSSLKLEKFKEKKCDFKI